MTTKWEDLNHKAPSTKDTRDLRDPQKLGEYLLSLKDKGARTPKLSRCYDGSDGVKKVSDYDHADSLGRSTVEQYRQELQEAADRGDKHALDTLRGIPNDEPVGD
jgi:hypothetical protein